MLDRRLRSESPPILPTSDSRASEQERDERRCEGPGDDVVDRAETAARHSTRKPAQREPESRRNPKRRLRPGRRTRHHRSWGDTRGETGTFLTPRRPVARRGRMTQSVGLAASCRSPYAKKGRAVMRKIIVGAQVSIDGVMQAPGGSTEDPTKGFKFGGWAMPYFDNAFADRPRLQKIRSPARSQDVRDFRRVLALLRTKRCPGWNRQDVQGHPEVLGLALGRRRYELDELGTPARHPRCRAPEVRMHVVSDVMIDVPVLLPHDLSRAFDAE